ncbi:MAG: hypothetical protein JWP59_4090 [Massilia sp.]|nr:hypothetical protein [Massilia sp.]
MNEQQNTDLVKDAYAAYARGDLESVLSCMTPQVEWELPAVPGLSFTGKRTGCDQVAEFSTGRRKAGDARIHPEAVHRPRQQGGRPGTQCVDGQDTGLDFESDWVHVFTVEDDRIAAFRDFMDAHVAVEAFQCYPLRAGTAAPPNPAPN